MAADAVIIALILIGLVVDIFDLRYRRKEDSGEKKQQLND